MAWMIALVTLSGVALTVAAGVRQARTARDFVPECDRRDEQVRALLRRLHHIQELFAHEPQIARIGLAERLSADALAYHQLLVECAATVGVDVPEQPLTRRLSATEQLHLEVELADRGLRW